MCLLCYFAGKCLRHKDKRTRTVDKRGVYAIIIVSEWQCENCECRFIVNDPRLVNTEATYLISYEKLYCGANAQSDERLDPHCWFGSVVVNTEYANDTIAWYWEREE